ncbi:dihydrodipicolinate synthase family protein [candidate division KSB1 bacterium]|nr:dihydrodipicolinate synthase family protein [candidate division KSB1 bacterium]
MKRTDLPAELLQRLQSGTVIPAHPLALDHKRKLDEARQRALTRYYLHAGAGGLAVAVHTTQFEIRQPGIDLFKPVLELAAEEIDAFVDRTSVPIIKIAGAVGKTEQAVREAAIAADLGYHAVLLSMSAFKHAEVFEMIEHCQRVADVLPLVGFYLQGAVGGRRLDVEFWRRFALIENTIAIKIAPFNRYQTLDVIRGVAESGRADEVALYTGNDDNIVHDLVTDYPLKINGETKTLQIVGGLLGHWAVWTRKAVELLEDVHDARQKSVVPDALLSRGIEITDSNAAFFDVAHDFAGCIVGVHEVLRRQGLLKGTWTLNEDEGLTPQQAAEIDRVYAQYPHLSDDDFVNQNLDAWLTP